MRERIALSINGFCEATGADLAGETADVDGLARDGGRDNSLKCRGQAKGNRAGILQFPGKVGDSQHVKGDAAARIELARQYPTRRS